MNQDLEDAVSNLCDAVEPLCGFRPDGMAQAISLLATRLMDTMPAIEALSSLSLELSMVEQPSD